MQATPSGNQPFGMLTMAASRAEMALLPRSWAAVTGAGSGLQTTAVQYVRLPRQL